MTAARDDDFMALPGMEADSTDTHHARERSSDDAAPTSSESALDALLDEYRACAKSEHKKGTLFGCHIIVDTSDTPWGNDTMKAAHPRVRADSQRRPYCRGVPGYPTTNAQPYCHY